MAWRLKQPAECGTPRGYDYHTRQLKEQPCPECREAKRLLWRERRQRNRDRINTRRRIVRKNYAAYERASSNRRNDFAKVVNGWSYALVLETYGATCYLCEQPIDLNAPRQVGRPGWELGLHIDHVVPISRGGSDTLENVKPTHAYCNQTKGTKC
jgi:5-methylcytosine-specific restriction endonuclease McrA